MNVKYKGKLIGVMILFVSILMMLIFNRFDNEWFLCDDNVTQWYPVMETAYSEFFDTGKMPVYDFYQFKGFNIVEPGYYCIINPIMLLCYGITRFLSIPLSCVTVYIILLFALGNVVMYALLRELKCSDKMALTGVLAYSSFSVFFYKFIWYYVFNNYLIVPLMFYAMVKCRDSRAKFFSVGIILALDIYLGNIQYTFYHYMLYGILGVGIIAFSERKYIKAMLANFFVGLCFSIPVFMLVLNAAQGFNTDANDFLAKSLMYTEVIWYYFIPFGLMQSLGVDPEKSPFPTDPDSGNGFALYTAACTVPIVVMFFVFLKNALHKFKNDPDMKKSTIPEVWRTVKSNLKNYFNRQRIRIFILIIPLIIFLNIFCCGIIARILSRMPLIKQFRYLYKAMFVFVPVYVVFSMIVINSRKPLMRKKLAVICIVFGVVGCINNFFIVDEVNKCFNVHGGMKYSEKKEQAFESISDSEMDLKNYRAVCIFENSAINMSKQDNYFENLSRNFPTALNTFSLSGYEISIAEDRLLQFDSVMPKDKFLTIYGNGSFSRYFLRSLKRHPNNLSRQLISNSVKYLIIPNNKITKKGDFSNKLIDGLDFLLDDIEVVRTGKFSEKYNFIEIGDVSAICTDESGNPVAFEDERMDLLSVKANGINELRFSLAYDEGITAYSVDENGSTDFYAVSETGDGNISIDVSDANGKTVYVGYSKRIYDIAFVFEVLVSVLFVISVVLMVRMKAKEDVRE